MHTGSAICISVWAIMICILVVPHVLLWAIIICILVVPHVLVCCYNDMHSGSATV